MPASLSSGSGPRCRARSPCPGISILTTSAPSSIELVAAVRPGEHVGQVEHPDAAQRSFAHAPSPRAAWSHEHTPGVGQLAGPSGWSNPRSDMRAAACCRSLANSATRSSVNRSVGPLSASAATTDAGTPGDRHGDRGQPSSRSPWLTAYPSAAGLVDPLLQRVRRGPPRTGAARDPGQQRSGASRSSTLDDAPAHSGSSSPTCDHVAQRLRPLLLGDAHPVDVAQHVEVHRLAVAGAQVAHHAPGSPAAAPSCVGPGTPSATARDRPCSRRGGPQQAALLQRLHQAHDRRLGQPGRLDDVADRQDGLSSVSSDRMSSARRMLRTPCASAASPVCCLDRCVSMYASLSGSGLPHGLLSNGASPGSGQPRRACHASA